MFVQSTIRDLRYAMRQLRHAPGFTLAAVLTLALGIASLATVFTWIKAVMFDPYPHVSDPRSTFVIADVGSTSARASLRSRRRRFRSPTGRPAHERRKTA